MTTTEPIHIIYLGRETADAEALRQSFVHDSRVRQMLGAGAQGNVIWNAVGNQKMAMSEAQARPPRLVLVETDSQPESRLRFGGIVRHRWPQAALVAVCAEPVGYRFEFDAILCLPIDNNNLFDALYRMVGRKDNHIVECGPVRLDWLLRVVDSPQGRRQLTPKQASLLRLLMTQANVVIERAQIMRLIWETSFLEDTRTLDVHVRWLRETIEPDPSHPTFLRTQRGVGYYFHLPE